MRKSHILFLTLINPFPQKGSPKRVKLSTYYQKKVYLFCRKGRPFLKKLTNLFCRFGYG